MAAAKAISIALLMSLVVLSVKFAAWLHSSSCIRPTSYGTLASVRKCDCVACDVVMCRHCRENNWDHEKSSLRRGGSMPPAKARKFEEMLDDEAPLQKQTE